MVKLAQHIEWSSPIPSRAGEATEKKTSDQVLADGKPRKTLAQLFESRITSLSSTSPVSSTPPLSSEATAAAIATPLIGRTASSLSTSSSASSATTSSATAITPSQVKATSPAPSSAPLQQSARTPLSSSTNAHVTFLEDGSGKYRKHAHTPAAHQTSEIAGSIKRSSSARKIADSSRHEGVILRSGNAVNKGSSISGPLDRSQRSPRNPLTNARIAEHSHWNDSAKLSSGDNGRPNKTSPQKSPFGQEKVHSSSAVALSKLEPSTRSPFAKFRIYEHNQISFLQKSLDTVETLQNGSRFRPKKTDSHIDKASNAEYTVRNTLLKEKKVRKGLFGLLTEASTGKDLARESKAEDVSGNMEKAANTHRSGGKGQDVIRPQIRTQKNGSAQTNQIAVSLPTDEYPGRKIPGNLSMLEESKESSYAAVEIPDKMVGLAWIDAEPRFLKPGSHSFPSDKFLLEEVVSDRTRYLKHGFLHRVYIDEGHLGVAWVDGKAVLLDAGVSVHISPSNKFSFTTTDEMMMSEKEFVLGPFRIVTVDESEVGIKFCNRLPQILHPGRHCLSISKVEVFAGFESLLRRQSYVNEAHAISRDDMKVSADAWVEWQIKVEDAAAARLANITDVEGAVCCKVRRAFNLVVWEVHVRDMNLQPEAGVRSMNISDSQLVKSLSSSVLRECQELFEEGWTVTIWDLQLKHILIQSEGQVIDGNDLT